MSGNGQAANGNGMQYGQISSGTPPSQQQTYGLRDSDADVNGMVGLQQDGPIGMYSVEQRGNTPGPPQMGGAPASPSLSAAMAHNDSAHQINQIPSNKSPLFFREEHAGFIARGNFATLALKPQLVEEGEWLAHQGMFGAGI